MNPAQYRNRWLKYLRGYEKTSRAIVRAHLKDAAGKIPFNELTPARYKDVIVVHISLNQMEGMMLDLYNQVGLAHGRRVGEGIKNETKAFTWDDFKDWFSQNLPMWLLTGGMIANMISIRKTFYLYLIAELEDALNRGLPFDQAVAHLKKIIGSRRFYEGQINRIATTEAVGAANFGAQMASSRTGVLTEKMWISAQDNRTRFIPRDSFDHYEMHEKRVGQEELFSVRRRGGGFENIRFPGDPRASLGNRINCRCTMGFVPVRDRNGDLVFTDSRSRPTRVLAD